VFVDQYSSAYGGTQVSAYGGQADKRVYTATGSLANFESGTEPRGFTRATATGLYTSRLAVDSTTVSDGAGKFSVKQTASGTTGSGDLVLRDAFDLSRARAMTLRLAATTGSGKAIAVSVSVRTSFGTSVSLGTVTVPSGKTVTSTLSLPAAAKNFRNEFVLGIGRTALNALGTTSAQRVANIAVKDVTVVV
ncbi:MAG: hypothetical protein LC640_13030, partial [Frankia sp.]|nr:hypothetical protein [Frankia sp.]